MTQTTGRAFLWMAGPAVLGAALMLMMTRPQVGGVGLTPDSISYLAAAQSLHQGRGVSIPNFRQGGLEPMTHWPPLYPACLAGLRTVGVDLATGARWLAAVTFGLNGLLVGLLTWRLGRRQAWLGMLAALAAVGSVSFADAHLMAWTEGLFVTLTLTCFWLLASHLDRPQWGLLIAAAVAAGLSMLTRYLGAVVIGTGALALLLWSRGRWRGRIGRSVLFGLVASVGPGAWLVRNRLIGGSATNRALAWHPIDWPAVERALLVVGRWFVPYSMPVWVRLTAGAAAMVLLPLAALWAVRSPARSDATGDEGVSHGAIARILVLFAGAYVALLVVSISLMDAMTPLDNRILSPVHAVLTVLLFAGAWQVARRVGRGEVLVGVVAVILLGFAAWRLQDGLSAASDRTDAEGFASRVWRDSDVLKLAGQLGPQRRIYSNVPEIIFWQCGRQARFIPAPVNPGTGKAHPDFDRLTEEMARLIRAKKAVIVFFPHEGRPYIATTPDLLRRVPGLAAIKADSKATLYVVP